MFHRVKFILLIFIILILFFSIKKYSDTLQLYKKIIIIRPNLPLISQENLQQLLQNQDYVPYKSEKDPYELGIDLRKIIIENQLLIKNYRIFYLKERAILEFQTLGSIDNQVNFIHRIHKESLKVYYANLSLAKEGELNVTFQILSTIN